MTKPKPNSSKSGLNQTVGFSASPRKDKTEDAELSKRPTRRTADQTATVNRFEPLSTLCEDHTWRSTSVPASIRVLCISVDINMCKKDSFDVKWRKSVKLISFIFKEFSFLSCSLMDSPNRWVRKSNEIIKPGNWTRPVDKPNRRD